MIDRDKHDLVLTFTPGAGEPQGLSILCHDKDNEERKCFADGASEDNCWVQSVLAEVGWEALEVKNSVPFVVFNFPVSFNDGDPEEPWIIVEGNDLTPPAQDENADPSAVIPVENEVSTADEG